MSRSNPPLSPMPDELREHLDALVQKYRAARLKEDHLKRRMNAMTARLRIALAEIMDKYYERFTHVEKRRKKITAEFLELWSKHLSGLRSVSLPSAVVRKRRDIEVKVLDKRELIDALDRLDLDARRSAEAVRGMLDRAEADFQEVVGRDETALGIPKEKTRTGTA